MTLSKDGEEVCQKLRNLHAELLEEKGIDHDFLNVAADAIEDLDPHISDFMAMQELFSQLEHIRKRGLKNGRIVRWLRDPFDIKIGINAFRPADNLFSGIIIYFPECFFFYAIYKKKRAMLRGKPLDRWDVDWEWRPSKNFLTEEYNKAKAEEYNKRQQELLAQRRRRKLETILRNSRYSERAQEVLDEDDEQFE